MFWNVSAFHFFFVSVEMVFLPSRLYQNAYFLFYKLELVARFFFIFVI